MDVLRDAVSLIETRSASGATAQVQVVPQPSISVESVLLRHGDKVGHGNIAYVSRMNNGVVVFV